MQVLIAAVYAVLALFGSDLGSQTFIDRIRVDGADVLVSKVVTQPVVTRFECVRSTSGRCYYTVFRRDCASTASAGTSRDGCLSTPVTRFALAKGDLRRIPALPEFRLCVSGEASIATADCGTAATTRGAAKN
jgi:hypothetical protein